jgi:retinol-binding protein 3
MSAKDPFQLQAAVVKDIVRLAREKYVFPEVGERTAVELESLWKNGRYSSAKNERELAEQLTIDLRRVSQDQHWAVLFDPLGSAGAVDPEHERDPDRLAGYLEAQRKLNYGFQRVEILKGNIGYIDLRSLQPCEFGGETAVAAMEFVANCDALIFDLTRNHGGYPSMELLLISYLVERKPVLINTFYYRPTDDTQQFWTFPHVPGRRMPDIPVYVLVSVETGSAAEAFAYELKSIHRALIVGEATLGAAHPVNKEVIQNAFTVLLPYGRPINAITGTNWEGTGVEPHIAVPAGDALHAAHVLALRGSIDKTSDAAQKADLEWDLEIVDSEYVPAGAGVEDLERCAGRFGKRTFFVKDGALFYAHEAMKGECRLTAMTTARFRLDEDVKFDFLMEGGEKAAAVAATYRGGRPSVRDERSGDSE